VSAHTGLVLTEQDTMTARAFELYGKVIASVDVDGLTIQSSHPGQLTRLAETLLAAEAAGAGLRAES
jgi:hypothetical protein